MNSKQEQLLNWLNGAYAMEQAIVKTLQKHAGDAEEFPEIKAKIEEHITQTENQAEKVKTTIERLGGAISITKEATAKTGGFLSGMKNKIYKDTILQNTLEEFATEQLEIATYTSIATAAEDLEDDETADMCTEIIAEEQETADWLMEQVPIITSEFMEKL